MIDTTILKQMEVDKDLTNPKTGTPHQDSSCLMYTDYIIINVCVYIYVYIYSTMYIYILLFVFYNT